MSLGCVMADQPEPTYAVKVQTEQHIHEFSDVRDVLIVAERGVAIRHLIFFDSGKHVSYHGVVDNEPGRECFSVSMIFEDRSRMYVEDVSGVDFGAGTATVIVTDGNETTHRITGVQSYQVA